MMRECKTIEACLRKREEALRFNSGSPFGWDTHCVNCSLGLQRRMSRWKPESEYVVEKKVISGVHKCKDCSKVFPRDAPLRQIRCMKCYRIWQKGMGKVRKCQFCRKPLRRNNHSRFNRCGVCYKRHIKNGFDRVLKEREAKKNGFDPVLSGSRSVI